MLRKIELCYENKNLSAETLQVLFEKEKNNFQQTQTELKLLKNKLERLKARLEPEKNFLATEKLAIKKKQNESQDFE